jgi:DNA-binding response OmpR family regulator
MPNVLLVEDDPGVRDVLSRAFEVQGWTVRTAVSAADARRLAAAWPLELIVTDVVLPDTHGFRLGEELRETMAGVPIVFISGYPARYLSERLGARDASLTLLQKPFTFLALMKVVARVMGDSYPSTAPLTAR